MATVRVMTYDRMKAIEDRTIVGASFSDGDLILRYLDGSTLNAGPIVGGTTIESPGAWEEVSNTTDETPLVVALIPEIGNSQYHKLIHRVSGELMNNTGSDVDFTFRLKAIGEGLDNDILAEFEVTIPTNPSSTVVRPFFLEGFMEMGNALDLDNLNVYGIAECKIGKREDQVADFFTHRMKTLSGLSDATNMTHDNGFCWTIQMSVASANASFIGRFASA